MDYVPLNLELMSNPYNWVVVFLMVSIAGVGVHWIAQSTNLGGK